MKTKTAYFLFFLLIAAVISLVFYFKSDKKVHEKTVVSTLKSNDSVKAEIDSLSVFSKFAKDFNSHKAKNLDQYIDPKLGMMMYYHDGPYPIISLKSSVEDEIDWLESEIFENVKLNQSPNYIGDFKFAETGFFVSKNNGSFSLKNFDNSYTSHPDSFFEDNKKLEILCNFRATGISKDQKKTFDFYFRVEKDRLTLLALETETVDDILFANPDADFIPFKNKIDIEKYFTNYKIFVDKEQNAYINFDKKEITYYDFPDDTPFIFEHYEIGKIEENSSKIKSVEVIFYPNESKEDGFITFFSNKGRFVVYPMGVRPPYFYDVVKSKF
ncbi:hypothetical protein ASG31_11460 [Chryseobacterium sp. Leaf404]|uniref:hypothetical protein n=1 Tax=unclassified Chryseobacterium TaxID=2593645 RepID=UPI0006FF38C9|nr:MULTISPECIES: hypothetical protein [unclassified Chryseobacterium]KQT16976.1 hypothetical protein ASG31_11460 [Chryseobacterium sp. Leaf404]